MREYAFIYIPKLLNNLSSGFEGQWLWLWWYSIFSLGGNSFGLIGEKNIFMFVYLANESTLPPNLDLIIN